MRYGAFLRAVNVGGRVVRMAELVEHLTAMGLGDVETFIASGNVLFTAPKADPDKLGRKIGAMLEAWLGYPVVVMVRSWDEVVALVASNPFKGELRAQDAKLYVAFLWAPPARALVLPYVSAREGMRLFKIVDREAFMVSERLEDGTFGVPNLPLEKAFGVPCTTRNWNTVLRIVKTAA